MENLISKELLSEVLGFNIDYIVEQENTHISWHDEMGGHTINIYELAHKCKEWALNKGHRLLSGFDEKEYENSPDIEYSCIVNHIYCEGGCRSDNNFNSYSEPESIFKACKWILDNEESK